MAQSPNLARIASTTARTLRAFGQRVPGAGGLLAQSLMDAVDGRIVMITGASSGIGHAAALKVGAANGRVLLVARTEAKLRETAEEIGRHGGTAHVHACDLSDPDDFHLIASEVPDRPGVGDLGERQFFHLCSTSG